MKKLYAILSISMISSAGLAQNNVTFSANDSWVGYVNVFETPANGGGYLWGSQWGIADLQTTINTGANTMTLQPNFNLYAADPTDAYWVDQSTGEGAKYISASTYVEPGPTFNGNALTFQGDVLSNNLDLTKYEAKFYINALDSTNGYVNTIPGKTFNIPASGHFTVSATAGELPVGMIIQYGFTIYGRNANPANEAALGSIVIGVQSTAGITEGEKNSIRVYPNPATDLVYVASDAAVDGITITDIAGHTVYSSNQVSANGIDVSGLTSGVYMLHVTTGSDMKTSRFTKK
ncbi:T9SS type A sorting domain-containing protein [Fluviicola sp.]|uniref:T9SS type A sorting domain-containing protein n=1 Tax=Fluviicola sp. TaxID=1917219 RepID=UPI0031E17372